MDIKKIEDIKTKGKLLVHRKKKKKQIKEKRDKKIEEIENKIKKIQKMNITEYLQYLKSNKKKNGEIGDDESTIAEAIDKILKIKDLINDDESNIKFEIDFD